MSWIRVIDDEEASGDLAGLYGEMVDRRYGRVDTILQVHSLHPGGLRTHYELYREVMRGTQGLPRADREMIAVVVSIINDCHY